LKAFRKLIEKGKKGDRKATRLRLFPNTGLRRRSSLYWSACARLWIELCSTKPVS